MRVKVIDKDGKALRSCHPGRARTLLKSGVAKVAKRAPFTIRLITNGNPEAMYIKEDAVKANHE